MPPQLPTKLTNPPLALLTPLPLGELPYPTAAAAARAALPFSPDELGSVEFSLDPFGPSFRETVDITGTPHPTTGFVLHDDPDRHRPRITDCTPGTKAARIPRWRSRLRFGYVLAIDGQSVNTTTDVIHAIAKARQQNRPNCQFTVTFDELKHTTTQDGVPQLYFDQLNVIRDHLTDIKLAHDHLSDALQMTTGGRLHAVQKFTRRTLEKRDDWPDWAASEHKQLNQYAKQDMFGSPIPPPPNAAVFNWVWTYVLKTDGTKKARGVCDGSTRGGQVRTQDHTYASCVEQTSLRLFYALCALESLVAYGADASNAFAEAPPPKQTFYMRVDKVFKDWWENHLGRPSIPFGHVLPVQHALQGHPESPRLWETHINGILRDLGFVSTTHEPCLYRGVVNGHQILVLRQVDDFAVGAPDEDTYRKFCDAIDSRLHETLKRQGIITHYNGLDVAQTTDYIKVSSTTYLRKILSEQNWDTGKPTNNRPIPMSGDPTYLRSLDEAVGPTSETDQNELASRMGFSYRQKIGELIWAMITCRPDLSFPAVKLSQYSANPAELHYVAIKNVFRYLRATLDYGLHYWRTKPLPHLPAHPAPPLFSQPNDLLIHDVCKIPPTTLFGYVDSDWAADTRHRRSVSGIAFKLAGSVVAYKTRYQPTVSTSSTEAELLAASDAAKMALYLRSILDELDIPQHHATLIFEDNDGALHMANASQPTKRARHLDIRHFALLDWVEQDLVSLAPIKTSINCSDAMTKSLNRILFYRHMDSLMGRIPPPYSPVHSAALSQTP
jgi:hypothetical protein